MIRKGGDSLVVVEVLVSDSGIEFACGLHASPVHLGTSTLAAIQDGQLGLGGWRAVLHALQAHGIPADLASQDIQDALGLGIGPRLRRERPCPVCDGGQEIVVPLGGPRVYGVAVRTCANCGGSGHV